MKSALSDPLLIAALERLQGRRSRRQFLQDCSRAGLLMSSPWFLGGCGRKSADQDANMADSLQSNLLKDSPQYRFLNDVGRRYAKTTIRVVSEDTPPSQATRLLAQKEFVAITGIQLQWDLLPLDKVLARLVADTGLQRGDNDIYYLDQAWIARFATAIVSPTELLSNRALAYPDYRFDDILPQLVAQTATYKGQLVGIPYDIPILLMMYRRDILQRFGCAVPTDLASYLEVVRKIQRDGKGDIYGTTLQWKLGHYSLVCDTCAWLWAHGGSFFNAGGESTLTDPQALEAMQFMLELGKYAPAEVTTFDWSGQAQSFAEGRAAIMLSWSEFFPSFDDPAHSKIVGLAEASPCPQEKSLRSPDQCGFGEHPGISRQGGSCLAMSRYSKNLEASWIFLQWATSSDVTTRACLIGGGASPIRTSNYQDPRVLERHRFGPGTTRHFDVVRDAIRHRMGTEPHLPSWPDLASEHLAVEMSRMLVGQQDAATTLQRMAAAANAAAAPYRSNG